MLHGTIKVNHHVIGNWKAVRKDVVNRETGVFRYECNVQYWTLEGGALEFKNFDVYHAFDDGAMILTSKVLAAADKLRYHRT